MDPNVGAYEKKTINQYASPPEGNAISASPLSDSDEFFLHIPKFVLFSEILTLLVRV